MKSVYLCEAKEAFEIGLLTKKDGELVSGKQELHSFIKAAFGLATVHCRLHGETDAVRAAKQQCSAAMGKLYAFSTSLSSQDREVLSREIMSLISQVKGHLHVQSFPNADDRSYVPESFTCGLDRPILHGHVDFQQLLETYSQHHTSVCEVFESSCRNSRGHQRDAKAEVCITTLKTETSTVDTVGATLERVCSQDSGSTASPKMSEKDREKLQRVRRRNWTHSEAFRVSLDQDTGTETELPNHSNGGADVSSKPLRDSSSSSSWSRLSGLSSSASWEEVNSAVQDTERKESSQEHLVDTQCSTAVSEEPEGDRRIRRETYLLFSKLHGVSLQTTEDHNAESSQSQLHTPARPLNPSNTCLASGAGLLEPPEGSNTISLQSSPSCGSDAWSLVSLGRFTAVTTYPSVQEEETSGIIGDFPESKYDFKDWSGEKNEGKLTEICTGPELTFASSSVDPEGDTAESTDDGPPHSLVAPGGLQGSHSMSMQRTSFSDWSVQNADSAKIGCSIKDEAVDPDASTVDEEGQMLDSTEVYSIGQDGAHRPRALRSGQSDESPKSFVNGHGPSPIFDEDFSTTEEGEELGSMLKSSQNSSSCSPWWLKSPAFSRSSSEGESSWSLLNSSRSSFGSLTGQTSQEILEARTLQPDDLEKLLAGVRHDWLLQRLENTGVLKSNQLQQAHSEYNPLSL